MINRILRARLQIFVFKLLEYGRKGSKTVRIIIFIPSICSRRDRIIGRSELGI